MAYFRAIAERCRSRQLLFIAEACDYARSDCRADNNTSGRVTGFAARANDRPIPEAASATESAATSGPDTRTQAYSGETAGESDKELFWRQSVSELRTALRQTVDNLKRIELESTLLRQQFYSESDPFVRDSEVKPR